MGLTAPAVFKIVAELLEEEWIVSTRVREGARGQPRSLLNINPHAAYALGLNIDRDRLCLNLSKRLSMTIGVHWPEMVVRPGQLTEDAAAVGAAVQALSTIWDRRGD